MKVVKAESDRKFDESTKGRKWQEKKSFLVLHFQELKIYSGRLIGQHLTTGDTKNAWRKTSRAKCD